jgi:hypothetical protein
MPPPPPPPPYGAPPPYGYPPPPPHYMPGMMPPIRRTSGMAIAGFVLSFFCGLLGLIFSILGYNECKKQPGIVTGEGFAVAGIIISICTMLISIAVALANQ